MSSYTGWLLAISAAAALGHASGPSPSAAHFRFIRTTPSDSARFIRVIDLCAGESGAFREAVEAIPIVSPLPIHASDTIQGVIVGSAIEPGTHAPRFNARLTDLDLLPSPPAARLWHADSAWALTNCEALGHELTEARLYREAWESMTALRDSIGALAVFNRVIGRAHDSGLGVEARIASDQRTRLDTSGRPYGRRRVCVMSGAVHILMGPHTQTVYLTRGQISHIAYNRGVNLCDAR